MATALLLEYENDKKGNHLLQFATKAFFYLRYWDTYKKCHWFESLTYTKFTRSNLQMPIKVWNQTYFNVVIKINIFIALEINSLLSNVQYFDCRCDILYSSEYKNYENINNCAFKPDNLKIKELTILTFHILQQTNHQLRVCLWKSW